jgi:hypothetical protein
MGSSGVAACKTAVSASRSRSFFTNFGRRTRTATDAGRRSMVSVTSSPIRSKDSSPCCCTSGGKISISTRGSLSGSGLRPVGFCRVWARTASTGGCPAGPRSPARCHPATCPTGPARAARRRVSGARSSDRGCRARASDTGRAFRQVIFSAAHVARTSVPSPWSVMDGLIPGLATATAWERDEADSTLVNICPKGESTMWAPGSGPRGRP